MIVSDVMTRNVISVTPESTVEQAAKLMLARGISGLFVVDDKGDLAGVVTEGDLLRREEIGTERHRPWWLRPLASPARQAADLLRALIGRERDAPPPATDDRTARSAILDTLEATSWAPMTTLNVTVSGGVADVWGTITNEEERHAIRVVVENAPGVKTVHDHLVYIEPYTGTVIDAPE